MNTPKLSKIEGIIDGFRLQAYTKYTDDGKTLAYRNGTNTLGIIFFCLTFGTVLGSLGKKGRVVIDFFHIIDEVIMKMVYGIMWYVFWYCIPFHLVQFSLFRISLSKTLNF